MGFIKTNLLKVIEWIDDSNDTIVYRFPMDGRQIMSGSKLTVRESQIAIFVNKGQIADIFEPGMYKLTTANLPILTQLLSWPYGFKSPFFAEVYFINTKQFTNLKWGTSNPIAMRDKEFGTIRIRGFGTYAFKVDNPKTFLTELFGTNSTFRTEDISQYLKSMLVQSISDTIAESKISALDMACNLLEFSEATKEVIANKFTGLGLQITNFVIENISFPEAVEKAIDTRSSMGVLGDTMDTYVKYTTVNAMAEAAKNPGEAGTMAGAGVGLGAGVAMASVMKDALSSDTTKKTTAEPTPVVAPVAATTEEAPKKKVKFCGECGAELSAKAKFCDACGAKQKPVESVCPNCGIKLKPTAKFCDECGTKIK